MLKKEKFDAIKSEWKHLFHNKILLLSVAVIMFIPIMYGGFFLGSIWDPYGQTKDLPVAFVNNDTGAELAGEKIQIGDDIAQTLKKNQDLGWEFVDEKTANDGVENGHFYAVVRIPEDFSTNAASITKEKPQKAIIQYTVTPSKNYIGSLINEQAAGKIEESISKQITGAYIKGIMSGIGTLSDGLAQAAEGSAKISDGAVSLQSGIVQYTTGVGQIAANQQTITSGLAQLKAGSSQLQDGLNQTGSSLPTDEQITMLMTGIDSLQQGIAALDESVQHPSSEMTTQQQKVRQSAMDAQAALMALQTESTALEQVLARTGAEISQQGSATLYPSDFQTISVFASHTEALSNSTVTLLTELNTFTTLLEQQQGALANGTTTLRAGVNQFTPPAQQAFSGYTVLRAANGQLLNGSEALTNGISQVYQGSWQLANGTNTLVANSGALRDGADQLTSGSTVLSDKLQVAASQVELQPTGEAVQRQIVSPVSTNQKEEGNVPNYGYALAPYVLSLGLFVGALVFNVIYPIRKEFAKKQTAASQWVAKVSVMGVAAIVQATVLMVIMVYVLGLHPEHPGHFITAIYLSSLSSMAIVTLLVITLDNPGRFLAMVLLVLQLGASEGTFPIQTAPGFFQAIHPFLPMTYSICALREAISGGLSATMYTQGVIVLLLFIIAALASLFVYFAIRAKRLEPGHASISE